MHPTSAVITTLSKGTLVPRAIGKASERTTLVALRNLHAARLSVVLWRCASSCRPEIFEPWSARTSAYFYLNCT